MAQAIRTTCPYCGVGCGVLARRVSEARGEGANGESGEALLVEGDPRHPANLGRLCSKGAALADTLRLEGRLLHPQIHGVRVSWEQALRHVSEGLGRIVREHGADAVAFYASGQLLTEDYYVANKLMKGFIGGAHIDTNSRLCMSSAVAGHLRAFGEDVVPCCYEDLDLADLVVLAGSNTAWCHPVLYQRIARAKALRPGMRIVVIDPRRTATCDIADLHLPVRPGTDVWLFNGLLVHLRRNGFADQRFLARHAEGAAEALAAAESSAPDAQAVAAMCGIDAERIGRFFDLFASAERVVTAFSQGVNQSSAGTDKVNSIINCHLLTGRIARPGTGPFSLTGQPNAMGGREVGAMANMLAAHLDLGNEAHRRLVQSFWGSPRIAGREGSKAVDLFEAVHAGRIKAVWIMATNPAVSLPDAERVREALARAKLLIVSDCVEDTDTVRLAHVRLPALAWAEKDGTVTNSERRISRQRSFLPPPGEARPDWWIVCEVAKRMGFARGFDYRSPHEIFDEHARLSDTDNGGARLFDIGGLAGLTADEYETLEPVQWPVPRSGHGTVARPFEDGRFRHRDGRARLVPTPPRPPAHTVSEEFPFTLNTGRVRDQWHTMTRTGRVSRLVEHSFEPFVDLNGQDALLAGLRAGELARIVTRRGTFIGRVRTSGEIARGDAFVPIHWSHVNASHALAGALVTSAVDPLSGQPELKHTPARIEPFVVDWYGVLAARGEIELQEAAWWTLVRAEGRLRYELAGRGVPKDWTAWGRRCLSAAGDDADFLEYQDEASGIYRAAHVVAGRLEACVYVSRRPVLPDRGWLDALFAKASLAADDRMALLAGRPLAKSASAGPLLCACHRVGREALADAIRTHRLTSPRAVGERLKAGTSCGSCVPEIRALLAEAADSP